MPQWIQILDYADSYAYFLILRCREIDLEKDRVHKVLVNGSFMAYEPKFLSSCKMRHLGLGEFTVVSSVNL